MVNKIDALMKLADAYAETSFDQGLHKRTTDPEPEKCREVLFTALREALAAPVVPEDVRKDAERYRWLRDVSVPPHNFYLSVPEEFANVKYGKVEVDEAIDAAIRANAPKVTT